jgi:hypothetical protein
MEIWRLWPVVHFLPLYKGEIKEGVADGDDDDGDDWGAHGPTHGAHGLQRF